MARPCTKNRAPSSSCIDRAGLGLLVSPELMEMGLACHQLETMTVYIELSTTFDVGDEYRSIIEQLQNHERTIPLRAQLSRKDLEARIVELDLVVDLK